jgi:transposase-like protein
MTIGREFSELLPARRTAPPPEAETDPELLRGFAEALVERARTGGVQLTGEGGLLTSLVQQVLQTGLEVELADHLGYDKHEITGRGSGNNRNGSYPKTITTEIGPVQVDMPRDRNGTFEPVTVPKYTRRLDGLAGNVISLYAKGLTTGDIQNHLLEMYGTEVSRDTISRITDAVLGDMQAWQNRPLDAVYPVLLIDAIVIKVRDTQVANRPVYVAIGVNLDGERDVLGLWMGPSGGEGAKQWMTMLTELRNRGLLDALIVCCDGLKGLPDAIRVTWPNATVQTCVVHLVRNSLRYASKRHWQQITKQMRQIYTANTVPAAESYFADFAQQWEAIYPAMIASWRNSWEEFVPFLAFPVELRKVVYTTNAIESLNSRFRRAVRHRGHFPNETAALKVLYLVATEHRKNRENLTGKINGWKGILNTLSTHYGDRLYPHLNQ